MSKVSKTIAMILLVIAVIVGVAAAYVIVTNARYETVEYTVKSDRLPTQFDGFRIVQVSDLHAREWDGLAGAISDAAPDAILITGDLISWDSEAIPASLVSDMVEIAPTYYATGNHEAERPDYPELMSELSSLGVTVLEDECVEIWRGDDHIRIAGVVDPLRDSPSASERVLRGRRDDSLCATVDGDSSFTVLLAHHPEYYMFYDAHSVDVVFSGHAHGGAAILPFLGAVWSPGQGFWPEYTGGVYDSGNCAMVVSRGLGTSSEPFRFNCPFELVICTLTQG